jgi:hypothetical protein
VRLEAPPFLKAPWALKQKSRGRTNSLGDVIAAVSVSSATT